MTYKVDFKQLAAEVDCERVISLLGVKVTRRQGPQLRIVCPHCSYDRCGLSTEKKRFNCFKCGKHGDMLNLIATARNCSTLDAARMLSEGTIPEARNSSSAPGTVPKPAFDPAAYAARLKTDHEAIRALGLTEETCREWQCGMAVSGVLRGRLALPLADREGKVLGYIGRAVDETQPRLLIPSSVDAGLIFGAHRVEAGELLLVADPLIVITAAMTGICAVSFLTDSISTGQLASLLALCDAKGADSIVLP